MPERILWNKSIRLIHWALAIIITLNLFVLEEGDDVHRWIGYSAVGFVLWRFYLGIKGPPHVRFRNFPLSMGEFKLFIKNIFSLSPKDFPAYNPAASLTYILMWLSVIVLGISGFMMGLDRFWGDETLEYIHIKTSTFLKLLILFHLLGMTLDSIKFKRKTFLAMINGEKP
jgi:cytochrome b